MILPGCTRGHIRARYVLQGYLIRNFFFDLAIGGLLVLALLGPALF